MMLGYHMILAVFTSCTGQLLHAGYYSRPSAFRPSIQFRQSIDDDENCICYSNIGPNMADVLQGDQQRLAIYLYKDQNGNFKVYTPSRENQLLLPDLPIGAQDIIADVDPETAQIQHIFNPNYAVEVKESDTFGVDTKGLSSTVSEEQRNLNDDPLSVESHLLDAGVDDLLLNSGVSDPLTDVSVDHPLLDETVGDQNLGDKEPSANSKLDIDLPLEAGSPHPINERVNLPNKEFDLSPSETDVLQINHASSSGAAALKSDSTLPVIDVSESLREQGISDTSLQETQLFFALNGQGSVLQGLSTPNFPNSLKNSGLITQGSGYQSQLSAPIVANSWTDGTPSPIAVAQPPNDIYTGYEYVTFDTWFDQQMQRIQNTGRSPYINFDLSSVKQLLEKTLYENSMYVTKDGVLINSKGHALNVGNLKLRPILIGDTVAYNSLVNHYELPPNLPYLEAILVTSVNPPKILGVIPLGKTYIPRQSYRKKFDFWDWESISTGTKEAVDKVKPRVPVKIPPSRILLRASNANTKPPLAVTLLPPKRNIMPPTPRAPMKYGRKTFIRPLLKNRNKISDGDLKNVLKALLFDRFQEKKKVGAADYKGSSVEEVFEEKPVAEYDDEEEPWFRIIGGNAATSSGTPVSSKGRSGHPSYS